MTAKMLRVVDNEGFSLGGVVLNIYQNDLFYENLILQQSVYVDDHQLYSSNETNEDSPKVLGMDLSK